MRDIKALTGLRGYAALMVCLHHYNYRKTGTWFYDLVAKGDWGVIVFFVLSGFILAYVYQDWFRRGWNRAEYLRFLRLRIARIYPLHLLTLLLWLLMIMRGRILQGENDTTYTFGLNILLVHAWGFTPSISWNQPSWSISSEFFCYLLFSATLLVVRNLRPTMTFLLMVFLLLEPLYHPYAYMVMAVLKKLGVTFVLHQFDYGISLFDWFCTFAFGMLTFLVVKARSGIRILSEWLVILGLAMLGYGVVTNMTDSGQIRVLVTFASALVIAGIYMESRVGDLLIGNTVAVFLGDVSYALYLSHIMLRQILNKSWSMWTQVLAALAVAAVLHYGFEKPCRNGLRSLFRKRLRRNSCRTVRPIP